MAIALRNITKKFPNHESESYTPVLENIELDIPNGKVVSLFGPNGCGKTTILNIISGIEGCDSGTISINNDCTKRLRIGYVFQNFHDMLLPWESALENVAFSLRARGVSRPDALKQVISFLNKYSLKFPLKNYPYQLSVGQRQTVVLTKVLIQEPQNVLLDEPFSALDHEARFRMQDIVTSLLEQTSSAVVFVSHDVDEALYMSDELILLSKRPAKVIRRFHVPFKRPRQHDLLASTDFTNLRREVVSAFVQEVGV